MSSQAAVKHSIECLRDHRVINFSVPLMPFKQPSFIPQILKPSAGRLQHGLISSCLQGNFSASFCVCLCVLTKVYGFFTTIVRKLALV